MPESEKTSEAGTPFPCPNCGKSAWKADYYEAVSQHVTVLADEEGKPEVADYDGCTDSYDDGSTDNEQIVCRECGHEVALAPILIDGPMVEAARALLAEEGASASAAGLARLILGDA
jgi:hypothetical protein